MKKTLIAIAALVATGAFAQSSVQIDGIVDVGMVSLDMKGQKVIGVDRNLTSTSQINFRGTGDLGGGMSAYFRLENDMNLMSNAGNQGAAGNVVGAAGTTAGNTNTFNGTTSSWLNGEQKTGLKGGFGDIAFGALNNYALDVAAGYAQPFGTAMGSAFRATGGNRSGGADVRNDNTFRYETPSMGGFTIGWLARKQQAGTANANYNASLGAQNQSAVSQLAARYNAGPLNVILTRATDDALNVMTAAAGTGALTGGNKGVFTGLAGNYNLGAATIYGGFQGNKATSAVGAVAIDQSAINVGAKFVSGTNTFLGQYARLSNSINSTSSTTIGLGYEYALAKNAAFNVRYERIADGAGVAATTGYTTTAGNTDRNRMGVGIRYNF